MEIQSPDRLVTSTAPAVFEISPCVEPYNVSIPEYLRLNTSISAVVVSALVFSGNHVLLVQRAAHDFAPSMWEPPGGAYEVHQDTTLLHALARELWEETGLHLRKVDRCVGEVNFDDSRQQGFTWRKISFQVEVEENRGLGPSESLESITDAVKLDPAEHQDWGWATLPEVRNGKWTKGRLQILHDQYNTILATFGMNKNLS